MALTKVSGPLLHGSNDNLGNYVINNITGAAATFSSVSVGGTLTYDDVTNVDSVGIVTARGGLHVGAGGTIIYALSEDNGNVGIGTTDASHQITVYAKSANSVLARFKAVNRNSNFDIFTDGSSNGQANVKNNVGATKVKLNSVGDSYFTGGDVGIGTDSPDGKLDVRGTIFVNGDATGGRIFASGGNLSLTDGNGRQTLRIDDPGSGNTHTHVFDSNGRLGIGTTNPQDSAHVQHFQSSVRHQSFQSTNGDLAIVTDNNSNPALYIKGTGTADLVNVFDNTDEVFTIKDGGKFGFNDDDPERTIDVKGSNCMIQLEGTGGSGRQYSLCSTDDTTGAAVGTAGQFVIYDDTSGADRFTITGIGSVGINVSNPLAKFQINSNRNAETDRFHASNYHLALRNPADDTGEAIGMSFGISSNVHKVGAAILHERDAGGSQGSLQFYTSSDGTSISEALRITSDGYLHFGNTGHGTNKVGGQAVTGNDFDPYVKILSNTSNSWSMQIRNDTNTGSNGMFLRAGNNNTSTYTLYATGTNEHYPSFVVRGDGNVGIGSSSPAERLQIFGNIELNAYDNSNGQQGYYSPKGFIIGNAFDNNVGDACTDDRTGIIWQERGLDLDIGVNNAFHTKFNYQGRVGIAHSAPNAKLHIGVLGHGSAVGDETNPALQIGNTTNYRFAIHTTSEGAIIGNKNGDDGILFKTKLGNNAVSYGNAMRLHSRGYRESAGYHYGPWTFTNDTLKSTITIGDPGDGDYTIIKFILTIMDSSYRQQLFAGEYAVFASNANGGPGVIYQIAKIWDKIGSGNWAGGSVTVSVTSGGAVQVLADNDHNDAGGSIYIFILDVIGDRDGSTISSISN